MKFFLVFLPILAVQAAFFTQDDDDDKKQLSVPGRNPLVYCEKPDKYILAIDHVDLKPNPPKAGKNLTVTALGTLSQEVKKGAKVHVAVKYGVIKIVNMEFDLCDQAKNANLSCPLKKGDVELEKIIELPSAIPPGKYTVEADAYTVDEDQITCMEGEVAFGGGKDGSAKGDLR